MANRTRSHRARGRADHGGSSHRAQRVEDEWSLLDAIAGGELDEHLGPLAAAIDARRHLLHTVD